MPADVRLRVENGSGSELTGVNVTSVTVVQDDSGGEATVEGGTGPIGTLAATGPPSVGFRDLRLTGVTEGTVTLRAEVVATRDGTAVTGTIEDEFEVRATPLKVEVIPPEEPVRLEVREDGERDETGQLVDPTYVAKEVPVTVRVTISEDSDPVKLLAPFETVEGDGGIDVDAIRRAGDGFVDLVPQPVPFPASWVGPTPPPGEDGAPGAFPLGELQPGDSVDLGLTVTVETPGLFEIESIVEGIATSEGADRTVRGLGSGILAVGGDAILGVEIRADRDQGNPPRIDEGGRAEFTGRVENLSLTDTIDLAPLRAISLGQGTVLGPVELTEDFPQPGEFGFFEPTLAPGEDATFRVAVDTLALPEVGWELLSGRESVILDLALQATITDPDGNERDLDPAVDVALDVGNGRWTNGVRVEVDPKLDPRPLIDAGEIAWALYGESAEAVVRAGGNFFSGIPSMIAAMPAVLGALGNGAVDLNRATGEAELLAVQYAWTWAEYHAQVALSLSPDGEAGRARPHHGRPGPALRRGRRPGRGSGQQRGRGLPGQRARVQGPRRRGRRPRRRACADHPDRRDRRGREPGGDRGDHRPGGARLDGARRAQRAGGHRARPGPRAAERRGGAQARGRNRRDACRAGQPARRAGVAGAARGEPRNARLRRPGDPGLGDRPGLGREPASPHRRGWPPDHGRDPLAGRRDPRVARDDHRHDPQAGDGQAEERQPRRLQLPRLSLRRDRLRARRLPQPG